MKILKISKLKSGKYKIKLEDNSEIITYDDIILKYNVLLKKELDLEIIKNIENETDKYFAYDKVLKYIGVKMRSEFEINKYLDKLNIDEENKKNIINKLKDIHLIDNEKYVASYVADKINLGNVGPNKIKKELLDHDIDEFLIDDELAKYDSNIFVDKIDKVIQKKLKDQKYSTYVLKQKITNELLNSGFDLYMIKDRIGSFKFNSSDALEKDFNKLKRRLSNKYDGNELFWQIKNKLIVKGYSIDEVNEYLNNYE